jgi:DNA-binding NarL/FixJ family response regulator
VSDSISVLIVDDDALTRLGIRTVLSSEDDIVVVGEAASGRQAITMADALQPDVVLMDIQLPDLDGIAATERITLTQPEGEHDIRVIALTTFNYDEYVYRSLRAGASGFLLKRTPAEEIIETIRVVAAGEELPSQAVTREVIARFTNAELPETRAPLPHVLTAREAEILALIGRGLANAEIAEHLNLSIDTVKTHAKHVYMKCGVRDRVQAVIVAFELGLAP